MLCTQWWLLNNDGPFTPFVCNGDFNDLRWDIRQGHMNSFFDVGGFFVCDEIGRMELYDQLDMPMYVFVLEG